MRLWLLVDEVEAPAGWTGSLLLSHDLLVVLPRLEAVGAPLVSFFLESMLVLVLVLKGMVEDQLLKISRNLFLCLGGLLATTVILTCYSCISEINMQYYVPFCAESQLSR